MENYEGCHNESGLLDGQDQAYWELYRAWNFIYGKKMDFAEFIVWIDTRSFDWQTPLAKEVNEKPF